MFILTVVMSDRGMLTYQAENQHLEVIGEFLTRDVAVMTDVMRDFLSGEDSMVVLQACEVTKKNGDVTLKHKAKKSLPVVTLPNKRVAELVDLWEEFLEHRRPVQWIMFQPEEFGLEREDDELGELFEEMQQAVKKTVQIPENKSGNHKD